MNVASTLPKKLLQEKEDSQMWMKTKALYNKSRYNTGMRKLKEHLQSEKDQAVNDYLENLDPFK